MIAFPLVGAFILLVFNRFTDRWGHLLGVAMSLASFVVAVLAFFELLGFGEEERRRAVHLYEFIPGMVDMGLLIDPLSICFALLITGVGSLIHIYSIGYMAHDEHRRRFFSYLNLFVAAMLLLVLADNYVGLFIGWEGVGLASYLLIGFWQFKPSAATAAKKAFVVNRVGDFGLLVGMFIIWTTFGTLTFQGLGEQITPGQTNGTMLAIGLLLLLGACGKSAQLPLQSWLLDAMEGPTPVSALIHAATMVTAGVYLVVRSGAFFFPEGSGAALAVAIVGAATLLAGAIIGCAKDDIKKGLAGSTMSQIGYMMLGAGLGPAGYAFAIGHLITHGFFKADMFLGAGSVMHGMNDEVDMRKYGGLRKYMPITFAT
ncbi:NADH-quinone oxidoreductase subunit L, partial [Nonomuraea sp. NPDC004297]